MQQEAVKQTKKAVVPATSQSNNLPTVSQSFSDGGWDSEVVDTKDILIPKILLMHPTSELVKAGTRNIGEIIKSTTEEVVAKRGATFDVIIFDKWKDWKIEKKNLKTGRFDFVKMDVWTPENDLLPWDFTENGEVYRRSRTLNFYAVLASEATSGNAFPVKLSFSRTGYRAGGKIADAYARALMEKQPPTRQMFTIGSELTQGAEDSYFTFTVSLGKETTREQQEVALGWRKMVQAAKKSNTIADHEVSEEIPVSESEMNTEF